MPVIWIFFGAAALLLFILQKAGSSIGSALAKRATVGVRNNNPGNVRPVPGGWQGQVAIDSRNFAVFDHVTNGIRAMTIDLIGDIRVDGNNRLRGLMEEYAPSADKNNPLEYAKFLAGRLGIGIDDVIMPQHYVPLLFGIARFEGQPFRDHWTDQAIFDGINAGFRRHGVNPVSAFA